VALSFYTAVDCHCLSFFRDLPSDLAVVAAIFCLNDTMARWRCPRSAGRCAGLAWRRCARPVAIALVTRYRDEVFARTCSVEVLTTVPEHLPHYLSNHRNTSARQHLPHHLLQCLLTGRGAQ
jgi:hypothetical protein